MNDESEARGNRLQRIFGMGLCAAVLWGGAGLTGLTCHASPIYHSSLLIPHSPASLPPDVKPGHWAAPFVQEALTNDILGLPDGREFHGEAKVTHAEVVAALARLARALEAGKWQAAPSRPVPDTVLKPLEHGDWRTQKVTRYELARTLAGMGDYVANALARPASDIKNLGKSEALPKVTLKIAKTSPAYADLTYLASARMITPGSPLLKADDKPLLGEEMSRALADMVIGLTDRLTDLGLDENGGTPDKTFQKQPAKKKD